MKHLFLPLLLTLSSLLLAFANPKRASLEQRIQHTYQAALQSIEAGDYDKAEQYLKAVTQAAPKHGNAQYQLTQLAKLRAAQTQTMSQHQIKGVVLKKIELEEVSLTEAIEALKILVNQANGEEKAAPNIVLQDPSQKISNKLVSLSLNHIPAEAALQYMLDLTGAYSQYGEHIITILPR